VAKTFQNVPAGSGENVSKRPARAWVASSGRRSVVRQVAFRPFAGLWIVLLPGRRASWVRVVAFLPFGRSSFSWRADIE